MSYEGQMLKDLKMPSRHDVEKILLITLFNHQGTIKEFAEGEEIVNEIADKFSLSKNQRSAVLERIYRKENRIVKTPLWHRLLYRAANSLANGNLVSRPSATINITNKKEWMLTEEGYDRALKLLSIPIKQKETLPIKSFEVNKYAKKLFELQRPEIYNPINKRNNDRVTKESSIRTRGFRLAVIEAYDCQCAFCGLKINAPGTSLWEVEAAHIVPHSNYGKDDLLNGIALCRLHHWAFDMGWLTLNNDYTILVSSRINSIPENFGKMNQYDFLRIFSKHNTKLNLPKIKEIHPHQSAISWHREHIFFQ